MTTSETQRHGGPAAFRAQTSGPPAVRIRPWLAALLGLLALVPTLALAQITNASLSLAPSSISGGESATGTLSVSGLHIGPSYVDIAISGTAVPGTDYSISNLTGPDMSSSLSEGVLMVRIEGGNGQQGTATITAIPGAVPPGESRTLILNVVACESDYGQPCPTGATAELTILGEQLPVDPPPEPTPEPAPEPEPEPLDLADLPGLNGNQRTMGGTITSVCQGLAAQTTRTAGEQDLFEQCSALLFADSDFAAAQGVGALTPEQASAPRRLTDRLTGSQLDNIAARLSALRGGARGMSLGGLTLNMDGQTMNAGTLTAMLGEGLRGGAASADGYQFERLGIFINGNVDWGSKDRTGNEDGFDFNSVGITAGVDYRFFEGFVLGFALGYGSSNVDIDANGGDLDATAWSATLYSTYYATDNFYLEGSASYGWGSYDQSRNIAYSILGGSREAKADFDGNQYALMLGAGYDITRGANIFDLYGRLNYVNADLDGYREQGARGLDLVIGDQSSTSFRSVLGAQYTRPVSVPWAVLLPQAWLEWSHEFEDGDDAVSGAFANDPNRIAFALATDRFDSDFFRVGLGLGAQFGQGRTAFISYEAAMGHSDYMEQSVTAGVRLEF